MKLLHLSDIHLGRYLADYDLYEDQKFILDEILELITQRSIDAVLIAGDVYDKAIPSEAATNLLDSFLSRLAGMHVSTFMISGNHDSDDRLNYGSTLFKENRIYISAIYDGRLDKCVFSDGNVEVNIYLLPFVKASHVKHYFPDKNIETYEDAVRVILETSDIDETKNNILVAHQFVAGSGEDPRLGGSEGAGTQSVGLVEKIGYRLFDRFDYVALGHIHSPQRVGRDEVRYAGSPLKYSLSEVNNPKSVPIITIDKDKNVDIELVPLKPMRDLRHIKGRMKDLLNKDNVSDTQDFIYVTLTDTEKINNVMGIFRTIYPYTLKIEYEDDSPKETGRVDISQIAAKKPFTELIGDFYRLIYGTGISDEELEVMKKVAGEAGVYDEAD